MEGNGSLSVIPTLIVSVVSLDGEHDGKFAVVQESFMPVERENGGCLPASSDPRLFDTRRMQSYGLQTTKISELRHEGFALNHVVSKENGSFVQCVLHKAPVIVIRLYKGHLFSEEYFRPAPPSELKGIDASLYNLLKTKYRLEVLKITNKAILSTITKGNIVVVKTRSHSFIRFDDGMYRGSSMVLNRIFPLENTSVKLGVIEEDGYISASVGKTSVRVDTLTGMIELSSENQIMIDPVVQILN